MNMTQNVILVLIMLSFAAAELLSRRYEKFGATRDDGILESVMFIALLAVVQPIVFAVTGKLAAMWFPQAQGVLADWPWWMMAACLLVGDDMMQYWWHRLSHTPLLWPLHRAHHSAHYMSIRVTYRNNFFYYLAMPGLWVSGVLIYQGLSGLLADQAHGDPGGALRGSLGRAALQDEGFEPGDVGAGAHRLDACHALGASRPEQ